MLWSSAVSDAGTLDAALAAVAARVRIGLDRQPADFAVLFLSPHFAPQFGTAAARLAELLPLGTLLGCSAGGVIGGGHEVEDRPGVALTAAVLPDVTVTPFAVESDALPDADASPQAWHRALGVATQPVPAFVLLADPFSFDVEHLLAGLDYAYPASSKVGGLASGAREAGGNVLVLGNTIHHTGAVGVALSGNIALETVVAQGCRPIGRAMQVTRAQDNILLELDGEPPLTVLQELLPRLTEEDRSLLGQALFLGIARTELGPEPQAGDFLIRNVIGIDPKAGAIAVGERLQSGQRVQFHVRDARTSAEDLDGLLGRFAARGVESRGALLFSCLGRGSYLYGRADHDTDLVRSHLGEIPLGGFFCNGEIGPIAGTTHVHGYTSAFGFFRPGTP